MKRLILLIICTVLGFIASAQQDTCRYFVVKDGSMIWQKIYDCNMSKADIRNYFRKLANIKMTDMSDDYMVFDMENVKFDSKKFGYKWSNTPMLFNNYMFFALVIIDCKDNRYRVTVKNMIWRDNTRGGFMPTVATATEMDDFISKGSFKKIFTKSIADGMNDMLLDAFTIQESSKDDW